MSGTQRILQLALATGIVVVLIELLRRRRLRERFAAIWVVVAAGIVVATLFPRVMSTLSARMGFAVEANFILVLLGFVLLLVSLQLSLEVVRLHGQVQRLAEEIALVRLEVGADRGVAAPHAFELDGEADE